MRSSPPTAPRRTGPPRTGPARALRGAALTLLTAVALLLGSAPAWAHAELESSNPAANAALPQAPSSVSLTFSEEIDPGLATVTVTGPDGLRYADGTPTAAGPTLSLALRPLGPAGTYTIAYRVVSDDGHPVSGDVRFTLTAAGPGAGTPAGAAPAPAGTAASGDGGGTPVWPWIVGAVVVVLLGSGLALRRKRA